jgi:xylan 1,4-beta-xylosidase
LTADRPETDEVVDVGADGRFERTIPLRTNDIVLVSLKRLR